MKLLKKLSVVIILFQLGGCAVSYTLLKAGRINVTEEYSVSTGMDWSQLKKGKITVWTANGSNLERITFFNGVEEDETLFGDDKSIKFRNSMNEVEIAELFVGSLKSSQKWPKAKINHLAPKTFGSFDGFYFEIDLTSEDGLSYKGAASCSIIDKKLYSIFFLATELYYYKKYNGEFENILSSIEKVSKKKNKSLGMF